MTLKTVLIDDEDNSRNGLKGQIVKYCPELEIIGEGNSVESGLDRIHELSPDLVFLDIEMQDGSGFDLLQKMDNIDFRVVFVTAYKKYALEALQNGAFDFICKPVIKEELRRVIHKIIATKLLPYSCVVCGVHPFSTSSVRPVLFLARCKTWLQE